MSTSKKISGSLTIADITRALNAMTKHMYTADQVVMKLEEILLNKLHITLIDGNEVYITSEDYYEYMDTWNSPEFDDIKTFKERMMVIRL